ncbi:MAG: hypothetical protein HY785_10210 [Oscillatoriophycideae cyanobacterium NC_groundwater_1537_Pr4_S-0.65um_50_18]|nr:hypothetical protein [Oscillatoriophycideae cyanobacterium NC_groundwater_1537_Pr4_S-0.65um_50_18]
MQRKFLFWFSVVALIVVLIIPQAVSRQMGRHPGMMGNPGMGGSSDTQIIHQLFADHEQIRRTVEEIPGGIRAVTESDNPEVVTLIQSHVSQMYDRVSQQQSIPMIGMSSTLPTMLQSANQYQRQLRITSKGIEGIETSDDPDIVAVIQEHAQEITQFAEQGMSAMMNGRMR